MKILYLDWASKGRDADISEPVLIYLEKFFGHKVIRESIYQFEFKLIKYRPDVLILANAVGAPNNFLACKLASLMGIKVVTMISEGDCPDSKDAAQMFFWGWNKDFKLYEDLHLEWSTKNYEIIKKYIKNINFDIIKVSGATGFDKYKILQFMTKNDFLTKYKKEKFNKIILIASWGFDLYFTDYLEKYKSDIIKRFGSIEIVEKIKSNRDAINSIYKELIEKNPDILFILKFHPGTFNFDETEFNGLQDYENVVCIHKEENIFDLINVSDLLIAFESTTAMEAWLLNKKSILVTPKFGDFERSEISNGSPIVKTYSELQSLVNEFYSTNNIEVFEKLADTRNYIIKKIIEHDDGKNHIRAAKYIQEFIDKSIKKNIDYIFVIKHILLALYREFIISFKLYKLPFFSKFKQNLWLRNMYDKNERLAIKHLYEISLDKFYKNYGNDV
ncbi:MAG TPA: hypothetical protein PLI27_02975 [Ignavibacteriales bacterium]|nr:hypothetical protein [Ignavibacteriales bacterium]HOL81500.1 hypothetical protein [Ignavibacteriales bacterium]HOM65398.1 hypothetical protein [Ignavibacteriales bacterium]HPD67027.1 hypothetical protein [Ignavibacteriales bacterium]HPP33573.1 hypothetical protein [Ignavibacteriales bacterium]